MIAKINLNLTGGRINAILPGYRPSFRIGLKQTDCYLTDFKKINPGESSEVKLELLLPEKFNDLKKGDKFILAEGSKEVATGIIISLNE